MNGSRIFILKTWKILVIIEILKSYFECKWIYSVISLQLELIKKNKLHDILRVSKCEKVIALTTTQGKCVLLSTLRWDSLNILRRKNWLTQTGQLTSKKKQHLSCSSTIGGKGEGLVYFSLVHEALLQNNWKVWCYSFSHSSL